MLSFTRKRCVTVLVIFCCALFAMAKFGPVSKAASWSEILAPSIATNDQGPISSVVDGGWIADSKNAGLVILGPSNVSVSLPAVNATAGLISIPITVGTVTGFNVISYDLNVQFNSDVIRAANPAVTIMGTMSSGMIVTPNFYNCQDPPTPTPNCTGGPGNGNLTLSAFQAAPLTGSGTLVIMNFVVQNIPGGTTTLAFTDYTDPGMNFHPAFQWNEGDPVASPITNGSVTILGGNTPTSSATDTPTPSATNTPVGSVTSTFTPTPIITPQTPTSTPTFTATNTPTNTATVTATNTATPAGTPSGIPVSLPNVNSTPGLISVPITVGDLTGLNVISYDLNVAFDAAVVRPANPPVTITGTLSSGMIVTPNSYGCQDPAVPGPGCTNGPGLSNLTLSAFQAGSLTGSGTLVIMNFVVQANPGGTTTLAFADYTDPSTNFHPAFLFNEGDPVALTTNGSVSIPIAGTATATFTNTPTPAATNTPTATATATNTPTFTATATTTATNTLTPTNTATAAATATDTPAATSTATSTGTPAPTCTPAGAPYVVPPAYAGTTGTSTFNGPLANAARTYQLLIHANQLTGIVGQPITALTWRLPASATAAWPAADVNFTDYDIRLSGSVDPANRSLTDFSANVVGPQTLVRSGPLSITAGSYTSGGSPNAFGPDIAFDVPWIYSGGNLLIELRHNGFTGTSRSVDALGTATAGYGTDFSAAWVGSYTGTSGAQGNFSVARLVTGGTGCPSPSGTPTETATATSTNTPTNTDTPTATPTPSTNPLFAGVDDIAIPAALINVTNSSSVPAFSGFQVWGAAFDPINNKVYFNSGSTLLEWPVGGTVNTLGPITDTGGALQAMVGLAFYNGSLYGTKNIANEAIYLIDTTTRIATVDIDYVDGDVDCGGFEADPNTGAFYCTNDDATPFGAGLARINPDATVTTIVPYPVGQTDIDGLAISPDGKAYLVTDDANGPIFVYDLVSGTFGPQLTAPWPTSETFSGATWIGTVGGSPTPTATASPSPTSTITATNTATPFPSPTCQPAPGFVYALNDDSNGSFVYGFQVNQTTGALTPIAGLPVTAGLGGINSIVSERMVVDKTNARLYVVNDTSETVSAYSINLTTGALTAMPFSPISLGAGVWNTIAVHQSGSPLVVASNATNGLIHSFAITPTTATAAAGSPYNMGANVAGFSSRMAEFDNYYYVGGNQGAGIGGFSVDPVTGALTTLVGSPFASGAVSVLAYATDSSGRLYSVDTVNGIRAFTSTSGALTPVTGNPFTSGLTQRRFGLVHEYGANGTFYFVAGNSGNNVGVFQVSGSGAATTVAPITGSPFATGGTTANNLAMNDGGDLLFVGNRISRNITTFRISTIPAPPSVVNIGVQPSNTMGTIGAINGIGYITGAGGGCGSATPTNTPTPTATASPSNTPTNTPTVTSTATSTPTATATGTPPSIQFSSATYTEDESQVATVTVTRTGSTAGSSVVSFTTTNGTATGGAACTPGVDYISTFQVVAFNPGETSKTANVTICGDNITEPDQTINLSLGNPVGGTLGTPSTAVLTINDTATVFRNSTNIVINGGAAGAPYPSAITVAGGPPTIGSMRVTLYDFASQSPDNADFLLVGPSGTKFILLAAAGGISQGGPATLNFTDTAGQVVPDNGPLSTGDFEPTSWLNVGNFPAPAPVAPYNLPGSTVGGTGAQTLFGNFGGTNSNGVWNLYVRDRSLTPTTVGNVAGGWGIEFLVSTAAQASVSGRVTTANGNGIRNATVVITGNSLNEPLVTSTGSFGYYTFDGLQAGETYVVTVNSRRFMFSVPSRVISLVDNVTDADFVADPLE